MTLLLQKCLRRIGWLLIGVSLVMTLGLVQRAIATDASRATPAQVQTAPTADPEQLLQQGREHYQNGQMNDAIADWQQAAALYERQGKQPLQALALSYLSLAYQQLGNWTAANQAMATSLSLAQSATVPASIRAQILNTQGNLYFTRGNAAAALTTWQQAATLYRDTADPQRQVGNLINQAQAQQALGLFLRAQHTLDTVEDLLQQQPNNSLKALGLRSLGNVLLAIGNGADAQRVLQSSLTIATQIAAIEDSSAALISLGNAARSQPDPEAALSFYQQAAQTKASLLTRVQAQLNQLSLLIRLGRDREAETLISSLQAQLEQLPLSRAAIDARINLAQNWLNSLSKRQPSATADQATTLRSIAQLLATGIQQAQTLGDRRAESYATGYLGSVYEQAEQWAEAQRLTEKALGLAQAVNAAEIAYVWQWQLGRLQTAQGQTTAAIQTYQSTYQTLQSVRASLVATSADLQFSFRESVEPVYRELVDLLLKSSDHSTATPNLRQARQIIESLQLAELDNFFRTACLEGQAVAIDSIQRTDAAVIYPIILSDRVAIILSLPGQPLRQYVTPVPKAKLEQTLLQFRQNLEKPLTTPEGKALGQQLYDWLIRPLAAELQTRSLKTLVFVLDGALRNVPIAALNNGDQYLIEQYSIALTPGLQLLNPQPLQQQGLQTLAAGLTQERHGFSALSNVKAELTEIQAEVSSRVLLDQDFTSEALRSQVNALPVPIVHLATHGQFSSNADETFVLAWDKPIKVSELSDLLRRRDETQTQAIELLVLSACETAAGDQRAALGLAGVAVQSGARSTLASLWSLDDESGAVFMSEFYRQLANHAASKAEAVRQAQLFLIRDPDFRHPRYWAPYVLVGNWL